MKIYGTIIKNKMRWEQNRNRIKKSKQRPMLEKILERKYLRAQ